MSLTFQDLDVPLGGVPIQVLRTYDSRNKSEGDFGFGWRLDIASARVHESKKLGTRWVGVRRGGLFFEGCIEADRPARVTVRLSDGRLYEFEPFVPECETLGAPELVTLNFRQVNGPPAELFPAARDIVVDRSLADLVRASSRRSRTSMTAAELAYVGARKRDGSNSANEELARRSALAGFLHERTC